jgi:hypothetical protein
VDIFDATRSVWTTAALSQVISSRAVTTLPNRGLAMFAGSSTVYILNQCPAGCCFLDSICTQCFAGFYNSHPGQLACSPCPAGTSNQNVGSTDPRDCKACTPPTYSAPGQSRCKDCPAGSYCPDPANGTRICPAGYYCPANSKEAVACERGFLCSTEGLSQHSPCPSGHFCPSSTENIPCPSGTFSPATGGGLGF